MAQENKDPKVSSLEFGQDPVALGERRRHSFSPEPPQTFSVAQPMLLPQSSLPHCSTCQLFEYPAGKHSTNIISK